MCIRDSTHTTIPSSPFSAQPREQRSGAASAAASAAAAACRRGAPQPRPSPQRRCAGGSDS
eukprot:7608903-Alexandrium_andersonii.AAC.1